MAFDISGLGSYIENGKEYAVKAVAEAKTAKALIESKNAQFGVKGSAAVLKINSDVSLQKGGNCGRSGGTPIKLSNKNIKVVPIADEANLCPQTLWSTFYSDSVAKGQTPREELLPEFAEAIMNDRAGKIAATNEKLLWQGDESATGTSMEMFDGILEQTTGTTTVSGTTVVEKLQNFYMAQDVTERNQDDYYLFVGEDIHAEYKIQLASKNIYQAQDDNTLFGTNVKFFVTSGLNGTRKVVGSRLSNLHLGMDGEGDADNAELVYSVETKQFYQDFSYGLGIVVVWPEAIKKASL